MTDETIKVLEPVAAWLVGLRNLYIAINHT